MRYNNNISYVTNNTEVFQKLSCFIVHCHTFFNKIIVFEERSTGCSNEFENVYPRNVNQIREIRFDKLNSSGIKYTYQQKLFKILEIFYFETLALSKRLPKTQEQQRL